MTNYRGRELALANEHPDLRAILQFIVNNIVPLRMAKTKHTLQDVFAVKFFASQIILDLLLALGVHPGLIIGEIGDLSIKSMKDESHQDNVFGRFKEVLQGSISQLASAGKANEKLIKQLVNQGKHIREGEGYTTHHMFNAVRVKNQNGLPLSHSLAISTELMATANDEIFSRNTQNIYVYQINARRVCDQYVIRSQLLPQIAQKLMESHAYDSLQKELLFNRLDNEERQAKFIRGFLAGFIVRAFRRSEEETINDFDPMAFPDHDLSALLDIMLNDPKAVNGIMQNYLNRLTEYLNIEEALAAKSFLSDLMTQITIAKERYERAVTASNLTEVEKIMQRSTLFRSLLPVDPLTMGTGFGLTPDQIGQLDDHLWVGALPMDYEGTTYLIPSSAKLAWGKSLQVRNNSGGSMSFRNRVDSELDKALKLWQDFQHIRDQGPKIMSEIKDRLEFNQSLIDRSNFPKLPPEYKPLSPQGKRSTENLRREYRTLANANHHLRNLLNPEYSEDDRQIAIGYYRLFASRALSRQEVTLRRRLTLIEKESKADVLVYPLLRTLKSTGLEFQIATLNRIAGSMQRGRLLPDEIMRRIRQIKPVDLEVDSEEASPIWARSSMHTLRKLVSRVQPLTKEMDNFKEYVLRLIERTIENLQTEQVIKDQLSRNRAEQIMFGSLVPEHRRLIDFAQAVSISQDAEDRLLRNKNYFTEVNRLLASMANASAHKLDEIKIGRFETIEEFDEILRGIIASETPNTRTVDALAMLSGQIYSPIFTLELLQALSNRPFTVWLKLVALKRDTCRALLQLEEVTQVLNRNEIFEATKFQRNVQERIDQDRNRFIRTQDTYINRETILVKGMIELGLAIPDIED